jgi:phosphoglucosamine mutase
VKRLYFGTDGVRGPVGGDLMNPRFAARLGVAVGRWLGRPGRVFVGRDTRRSGPEIEAAVILGLRESGTVPESLGVVPTPAVARAVRVHGGVLGVVITASHNPACDNGIKFFGPGGVKLTDAQEAEIEGLLPADGSDCARVPGTASRVGAGAEDYVGAARRLLPEGSLAGWRIVVDTANGATCGTTPLVLQALGAEVIGLGDRPDGLNINAGVGSEHPGPMAERVLAEGARLGIAHDGDGDRCVLCDEAGGILDGDEILTILATHALARGALSGNILVATHQSNLGVDEAVAAAGGRVVRTDIGDRYVSARMRAEGATLGGESSGHVICADVSPTGDGLVAALRVIDVMRLTGRPLSELRRRLRKYPQRTAALRVRERKPLERLAHVAAAVRELEGALGARGRVMVRYSGTEAKLRLLVEGPTEEDVQAALTRLDAAVRADLVVLD